MGRSLWRLKYIAKSTINRVIKESLGVKLNNKNSMIMHKSSTIPECLDGFSMFIHKGFRYRELKISKYHIGFKFGNFVLTKTPVFPKKI